MNQGQHIATSVIGTVPLMTPQLIQRNPPLPEKTLLTDGERANILKFAMQQIQAISAKALKDVM